MLFSSALIGLREGLEAALVVSILVAFLVKTDRRHALRWVWPGVATAVLLSVAVGAILTYTTANLESTDQELLGNQQVAGTGDGQELGHALDDAEEDGMQCIGHADSSR